MRASDHKRSAVGMMEGEENKRRKRLGTMNRTSGYTWPPAETRG